jgi:ribosomal-protein-alanine N-acetyltransferase
VSPEALAALHAACFTHPRPWTAAEFAGLLAGPGVNLLTEPSSPPPPSPPHEGEGRRLPAPVGFLLARIIADEAEVLTLAVDPALRRQGTGGRLLARFLAEAAARGAARAFLEVAEDNPAALALYLRAGFAVAGRRHDYAAPGVDALVLARDLTVI